MVECVGCTIWTVILVILSERIVKGEGHNKGGGGRGYALNGVSALADISVDFWGAFGHFYLFLGLGVSHVAGLEGKMAGGGGEGVPLELPC